MKNPNLMSKLKALHGIHSAMDQRDSERLRPKKAMPMAGASDPMSVAEPEHTPGMHSLDMPGQNSMAESEGLHDDDKARLMELYSKLK